MRVLHVSTPMSWRGGEQQLAYLIEELQSSSVQHCVVCPSGSMLHRHCVHHAIECVPVLNLHWLNPLHWLKLRRVAIKAETSIVHTHDSKAHSLALLSNVVFGPKVPLVVARRVDFEVRGWFSRFKFNHPAVTAVVCVSHAIAELMAPVVKMTDKLMVVHSGVKPATVAHVAHLCNLIGADASSTVVGTVAALAPHKDFPTFLKMAERLCEQRPGLQVVIVGEGDERKMIEATLLQSPHMHRIHLLGFRADARAIIAQFDVFVLSSKTEGLGTSIIDAMLVGTPVVATDAGGISELIENNQTGLLAPVAQSDVLAQLVLKMLNEADFRNQCVSEARLKAEQFTSATMARKTMEVYNRVLASSR